MIATITSVKTNKSASFYELSALDTELKMLCVAEASSLKPLECVRLGVKAIDVAVSLTPTFSTSISNCLECEIVSLNVGEILATLVLRLGDDSVLESVISAHSARALKLKIGLKVYALIKATSFFIKEKI